MGGLISWYGLMTYPDSFAGAICMSTHWPGAPEIGSVAFKQFLTYIEQNLSSLSSHKLYFDYGDKTLDALYPPLQKQIDDLFTQLNYPKQQWRSLFFPEQDHSENAWSKRLHHPLEFMFPLHRQGAP